MVGTNLRGGCRILGGVNFEGEGRNLLFWPIPPKKTVWKKIDRRRGGGCKSLAPWINPMDRQLVFKFYYRPQRSREDNVFTGVCQEFRSCHVWDVVYRVKHTPAMHAPLPCRGIRQGGMHARKVCVVGGMRGRGACMAGVCFTRYYEMRSMSAMSGWYASYWNAFLFETSKSKWVDTDCKIDTRVHTHCKLLNRVQIFTAHTHIYRTELSWGSLSLRNDFSAALSLTLSVNGT